jgi:hypothetical protein
MMPAMANQIIAAPSMPRRCRRIAAQSILSTLPHHAAAALGSARAKL